MTAPASSIALRLCTTLYFSTASLTRARRRMPAVSIEHELLAVALARHVDAVARRAGLGAK